MIKRDQLREFWNALRSITIRSYDYVVILVALGLIIGFSIYAVDRGGLIGSVEIRSDTGDFVYPLDVERHVHIEGPLGHSEIVIENGEVRFATSPCRDKICVAAGRLSRNGEWTACLPNRVFLSVAGVSDGESAVDATAF